MLINLRVKNFKRLDDVEIELGRTVVFVGPNNSGKTTALQALALWETGLRKWVEKRSTKDTPEKRPGVTINRRDLIAVPVPDANLLWRDLHVRSIQRRNGKPETKNIRIDIVVSGVTEGKSWECGFEFDYANQESFYCRPLRTSEDPHPERLPVPKLVESVRVAFLPPMSGMAATEDRLPDGAVNVRIGEGRTAEVLRNLCFQIHSSSDQGSWTALVSQIRRLFGVTLHPPEFIKERGQITMSYSDEDTELDLVSSGRGLQQTLLLLAHLYAHPKTILLLDEPDAHLEILRQRQIYQILTETAESQGCQVIAASHSEVLLNEAADRDVVVAFVGKPHRIDDRGHQVLKSLRNIGFEHYYQAEQVGWVLYLEGSTDLAILQAFAERLDHDAKRLLEQPFIHYVGNVPAKAREHFFGLREAKPDLVGIAVFDSIPQDLIQDGPLCELKWRKRELENYLCNPETLLAFAEKLDGEPGPLFESAQRERQTVAMQESIEKVAAALRVLGKPDPFSAEVKASDEFLGPVFQSYFEKLELPNMMQKTDYHTLAHLVSPEQTDPEIIATLDRIVEIAVRARPRR
ncbi:MAG TPA: AAA family ATPase [Bryobacteraceae bacterium]|nr:AAA family ATPase [Bryobacteraceae bacterium]